ncbi:MAG: hypothetical protein ABUS56_10545 [Acidobacteriota bacterium]
MRHLKETNQRLLDVAAEADAREGIRQGLEDVEKGRTRPAREALAALGRQHPAELPPGGRDHVA